MVWWTATHRTPPEKQQSQIKWWVKLLCSGFDPCCGWDPRHPRCCDPIKIANPNLVPRFWLHRIFLKGGDLITEIDWPSARKGVLGLYIEPHTKHRVHNPSQVMCDALAQRPPCTNQSATDRSACKQAKKANKANKAKKAVTSKES